MNTTLPSVSEVNAARGNDLQNIYKNVFGRAPKSSAKPTDMREEIVADLKRRAKEAKKKENDEYTNTERAAFDAEKKGEWLTAALAWESCAKMLPNGPGKDAALGRAAKARINAKTASDAKSTKTNGTSGGGSGGGGGADAAKEKAALEKKAAKEAAEKAEAAAKEAAKAAKQAEREAKAAKEAADKEAAKVKRDAERKAAAEKKEADALAAKADKEAKAKAAAAEKAKAAEAAAAEKAAAKAAKQAEREAKKALKGGKKADEPFQHDPRIAHMVGQTIVHETRTGIRYEIKVLEDGFEYKGEKYKSLSAVGRFVNAGKSTNGFVFFGLSAVPRPEMKNTESIIINYAGAAQEANRMSGHAPKLVPNMQAIIDGPVPEAHQHHSAILAAANRLEDVAKALRLGAKLIEMKKGRPAQTA